MTTTANPPKVMPSMVSGVQSACDNTRVTDSDADNPLTGTVLLIRLGRWRHPGVPFTPPIVQLRLWLDHANRHNGRVLWTSGLGLDKQACQADEVIITDADLHIVLAGTIGNTGKTYNPVDWKESEYGMPEPWSDIPSKSWIAIDGLHRITGFMPSEWESPINHEPAEILMKKSGYPSALITRKHTQQEIINTFDERNVL